MKILLVGTGGVGEAIARIALERDPEGIIFNTLILGDFDSERLRVVQGKLKDIKRFPTEVMDAKKKADIIRVAKKYDVDLILNSCDPSFNEVIFDAAYEAEKNYLDMAMTLSEPHPTEPFSKINKVFGDYQFAQNEKWQKKQLFALVGMGMDPGTSNVFARFSVNHLFDQVKKIMIMDGDNISVEGYDVPFGFSVWTTLDECTKPALIWTREKGLHAAPPHSGLIEFEFPAGIGKLELVDVEHEEVPMLTRTMTDIKTAKGVESIHFKYALGADFIKMLQNLRELNLTRIDMKVPGTELTPRDVVAKMAASPVELAPLYKGKACIGAYVEGIKDGLERKTFVYQVTDSEDMMRRIECGPVVGQTAYNAVIALELVAKGIWKSEGVVCPDQLPPEPFIALMDEYDFYAGLMDYDSEYKLALDKQNLLNMVK